MKLVDTHCHIHFADYGLDIDEVIQSAREAGIVHMICVGCTLEDSKSGIDVAQHYPDISASIGLHPHEASKYVNNPKALQTFRDLADEDQVVAIGEIGLDYFYEHSDREDQKKLLKFQLTIAQEKELPVIFHVREAFADFWPIYDEFKPKGIIHSFTAGQQEIDQILKRGLLIGLNGIMTFTKNQEQLEAIKQIPLKNLVVETDAPYLTPVPFRGTICQPKHVATTAAFLSDLRGESINNFAEITTENAFRLFNLKSL